MSGSFEMRVGCDNSMLSWEAVFIINFFLEPEQILTSELFSSS
jgi:hypothetical protein